MSRLFHGQHEHNCEEWRTCSVVWNVFCELVLGKMLFLAKCLEEVKKQKQTQIKVRIRF